YCPCHLGALPSFPTRRSSDLVTAAATRSSDTAACSTVSLPTTRRDVQSALKKLSSPTNSANKGKRPPKSGKVSLRQIGHPAVWSDRKSTRLNSSHRTISYAVF